MRTIDRRIAVKKKILESEKPISASTLAELFNVSRQIIVGDVAILRASQECIIATPRGYIYQKEEQVNRYIVACQHDANSTLEELNTIVDFGGVIENVIVSHPIYGELIGALHISNRNEAKQFVDLCEERNAKNLSTISNGVHLHTITCKDENQYNTIINELKRKRFLYQI